MPQIYENLHKMSHLHICQYLGLVPQQLEKLQSTCSHRLFNDSLLNKFFWRAFCCILSWKLGPFFEKDMSMVENQTMETSSELSKPAIADGTPKKKVLLVDDVKLFVELEKTFFQRNESFEVLTAGNGKEALEIVEAERPDLIYLDMYMPEMNGDECCRLIKDSEIGKNIPVVMVTSAGSEEDRACCLAAGCDEIITKPVNRGHFLSVARKYLVVHEREESRYTLHVKVKYGKQMDKVLTDYSVNLNTGGLFLASSELFPVNTHLSVEFSMPEDDKTFCCQARVAWVNDAVNPLKRDLPVGMGLQFTDITLEQMNSIREYINMKALTADW